MRYKSVERSVVRVLGNLAFHGDTDTANGDFDTARPDVLQNQLSSQCNKEIRSENALMRERSKDGQEQEKENEAYLVKSGSDTNVRSAHHRGGVLLDFTDSARSTGAKGPEKVRKNNVRSRQKRESRTCRGGACEG